MNRAILRKSRLKSIRTIAGLAAFLACLRQAPADSGPSFARDIQPIFAEKCYACHGPDEEKREADLRFDIMEQAIEIGAVTPGDPSDSLLVDRIRSTDPKIRMPPPKSEKVLSDQEARLLVDWIAAGAKFEPHWSFRPIRKPSVPAVTNGADWIRDPIDAFILARLQEEGLTPTHEADAESLLRRVTFDLTGLPPTLDEMNAFLADRSPNAYERAVDRLLGSPRYGEHMAAGWLDVARYADTFGYQNDRENHVWPWRDWVIRAFNENLPYDEFITDQLAGDLLPNATRDQRLATAFNRLHRQTNEGGSVEEEFRLEYVADRTETFGTAMLGLTLECARCHDHKFDPMTQKDFYRISAFFSTIDESGMYSHFTTTAPTPAMMLFKPGEKEGLQRYRKAILDEKSEWGRARDEATRRFDQWLSDDKRKIIVREPIVHFSFDTPVDQDRIVNEVDPEHFARLSGPYAVQSGISGNAASFTGDNSIAIEEIGNFERSDPFSFSMWLYSSADKPRMVICHRSRAALDAASRGYEILLEGGRLVFSLIHFWPGNAIRVRALDAIAMNRWVHVAATYDGSSAASGIALYVDGEPISNEVIRDNLYKTIRYESGGSTLALRLGARFRDNGFEGGRIDEFRVYDVALSKLEVKALASGARGAEFIANFAQSRTDLDELRSYYLDAVDAEVLERRIKLHAARTEEAEYTETIRQIMVMDEMSRSRPVYLLRRGDYRNKKERVIADTPAFLPAFPRESPRNRLGLAEWLFEPEQPLTARVAANRLWQQLFGRGLAPTPEDFGIQGEPPLYPELLDYLATRYREIGWDTKAMLREIALSSVYRQSSAADPALVRRDPDNALLARGPRYRLSAEEIRDAALQASGLITDSIGGPSVKPYQPEGLWKDSSQISYQQDTGDALYRRSMYTFIKRTVPPPSMLTFDATNRETCVVRRERTETPLQALVLLNDPKYVEASRVLAERTIAEHEGAVQTAIDQIFRALTSRHPTDAQADILLGAYDEQRQWFNDHPNQAAAYLDVGEYPTDPALRPTQVAALTAVAQMVMNFDAFQMKR